LGLGLEKNGSLLSSFTLRSNGHGRNGQIFHRGKNEDSEGNSYTLIQGQVVGSDGGQYVKSSWKKNR